MNNQRIHNGNYEDRLDYAEGTEQAFRGRLSWLTLITCTLLGSLATCAALLAFLTSDYATGYWQSAVVQPVAAETKGDAELTTASISQEPSPAIEQSLQPLRNALQNPSGTVQRINALFAFNAILAEYGSRNGIYPNSQGQLVSAAKALEVIGNADYRKNVPVSIMNQMQYVSNGKSFKVIVVGAGDCAVVRALRPALVDPKRSSGPLDCVAYGYWSPAGANY